MIVYSQGDPKWRLSVWRALADEFSTDPRPLQGAIWASSCFAFQDERPEEPKLAGFSLVSDDGYLTYLYVRPSFRGCGIGSTLLERCTAARWLTCVPELQAYYAKRGFRPAGTAHVEGMVRLERYAEAT